jgi:tRNA A-37 threonylcarbamoyl transferase component Bud32
MAAFEFGIPRTERETAVYEAIDRRGVGPAFLGHILEGGRVLGFLVELVQGRRAGPEDLQECCGVVQRRHAQDIVHGDLNRHNFTVVSDGTVTLIDFEVAVLCGEVPRSRSRSSLVQCLRS